MKVLAIDSSAVTASVALGDEKNIIRYEFVNNGLTHSETLMPMVKRVMGDITFSELDAIAITAGPGSFTGVRIGIATVKGLAFADGIRCISLSTLEAIAANFIGERCIVCAVMDARRMQFYNALFKVENEKITRLTPDRAIALEELKKELSDFDRVIIAGDGAKLCYDNIALSCCELAGEDKRYQNASSFLKLAFDKKTVSAAELMPVYLRVSQAERELKLKKGV